MIAALTRRLQSHSPSRPLRVLGRLSSALSKTLPPYAGAVSLPDGTRLHLDSTSSYETHVLLSGIHQPDVTDWLHAHTPAGAYCLDVGANIGILTVKLAHWAGASGRVAAFGANPQLIARLEQQIALNQFTNVEIIPYAVYDRQETLTFYIDTTASKSSLIAERVGDPVQKIAVETVTIDQFMETANWQRLDVIKIDIEGSECRALLGAQHTLARFRPHILFEYWHANPTGLAEPVFDFLCTQGYQLFPLGQFTTPFDWRTASPQVRHSDIIALPETQRLA